MATAAIWLLILAFAGSPAMVCGGSAVVNFTNTVFTAPGHDQHADLQELQDTVEPFSALRNPEEGTVKVFFEVGQRKRSGLHTQRTCSCTRLVADVDCCRPKATRPGASSASSLRHWFMTGMKCSTTPRAGCTRWGTPSGGLQAICWHARTLVQTMATSSSSGESLWECWHAYGFADRLD